LREIRFSLRIHTLILLSGLIALILTFVCGLDFFTFVLGVWIIKPLLYPLKLWVSMNVYGHKRTLKSENAFILAVFWMLLVFVEVVS
jgi:hypothetical protein